MAGMDVVEFTGDRHSVGVSRTGRVTPFSFPREKRGQCECYLNTGVTSQRYTYGQ